VPSMSSVCTVLFLLGRPGLWTAENVTTHWSTPARARSALSAAKVEPDQIYVKDGRLYSPVSTAGLDLALGWLKKNSRS